MFPFYLQIPFHGSVSVVSWLMGFRHSPPEDCCPNKNKVKLNVQTPLGRSQLAVMAFRDSLRKGTLREHMGQGGKQNKSTRGKGVG